jgi:hypothetical protein
MSFWTGNKLFNWLLFIIGVRRTLNIDPVDDTEWSTVISRKVSKSNKIKLQRQPRVILRDMYKKKLGRDLSPPPNNDTRLDIPFIPAFPMIFNHSLRQREKRIDIIKGVLSWGYTVCILSFLSFKSIWGIYYLSNKYNHNISYISSFVFSLSHPFQYIFALKYFSNYHFEETYVNKSMTRYIGMNTYSIVIIIFTFITCVINIIGLYNGNDYEFPGFESLSPSIKILVYILTSIDWIIGRTIVYTNITAFTLVFCEHCDTISKYIKKLEIESKMGINSMSLNIITQDILEIRGKLKASIDHFKWIFSLYTIIGAIGFGIFTEKITSGSFVLFPWSRFVIYVILQTSFIISVYRTSANRERLTDFIREPEFIERFIKRYTMADVRKKFDDNTQLIILNMNEENSNLIDWIILDKLLDENWAEFKVMGFDISDGELIKKGIVIVAFIASVISILTPI